LKPIPSDKIPVFLEKEIYRSESLKAKVVVHTIYDNDEECGCTIVGKKGIYSLKFSDLRWCKESPYWELKPHDKVKILVGKNKDKVGIVTSTMPDGGPIFCKDEATNKSFRIAFFGHQVEKI
jgi:hypothetical protein